MSWAIEQSLGDYADRDLGSPRNLPTLCAEQRELLRGVLHPGVRVMWQTHIRDLSPTAESCKGGPQRQGNKLPWQNVGRSQFENGCEFRCHDCETRKRTGTRRPATMPRTYLLNMVVGNDTKKMPSFSRQEWDCWLSLVLCGVKLSVIVKTSTKASLRPWLRP